ncbi:hypothetical protein JRQ81_006621 [Phrynocephalus forsythii]|uniref:Uncharacterized protein n=1 Tax=Phrynocephalus forsythii TaxID=171643 RepID=A0A9Q0XDU0_9SAUR|nr:hypothetical protein JRQ81_006621 [Phrynocephalus forsythii]
MDGPFRDIMSKAHPSQSSLCSSLSPATSLVKIMPLPRSPKGSGGLAIHRTVSIEHSHSQAAWFPFSDPVLMAGLHQFDQVATGLRMELHQAPMRFELQEEQPTREAVKPTKESHYIGSGPDFQRSLFNLGGQSPLVLYYLQMHGITNTLANSRAYRINHTEIYKIPYPFLVGGCTPTSPTYTDAIKASQTFAANLHNNFIDFEHKCDEELAQIQEQREKVNRRYRRMLATITKKPTEARLMTEKFITQMENVKTRRTASSGANSASNDLYKVRNKS